MLMKKKFTSFIQWIPFNVLAFPLTSVHHCIMLKFAVGSLKATIRLTNFACKRYASIRVEPKVRGGRGGGHMWDI